VIRLGIRVRAADAEVAYARLEPLLAAGFEEIAEGEFVDFVIYGEDHEIAFPELVSVSRTPVDDGWRTAWHDHLQPVTVGAVTIRPPWIEGPGLAVDPGDTFGLASHPTTQLCLELLQTLPPTDLVDWGCGCGVLAVAAQHLGFAPVSAIEVDPAAVETARRNGVDARVGDVTVDPPWARTVVANLTAGLFAQMGEVQPPDGPVTLIVSGILTEHADVPNSVFGFVERDRRELDGWTALVLEKT
jgi:ribosomal protein L11 methyltransferase